MFSKRFASVFVVLMLFALVACTDNGTDSQPSDESTPPAQDTEPVTLGDLPAEPGYAWEMARYEGADPLQVSMPADGPWVFPSAEGWAVTTTEIVEPASVPSIDQFAEYDLVVRSEDFDEEAYYPRRIADGWLLQLGRIGSAGGAVTAEPYEEPLKLWPVEFAVGDTLVVLEGENFRVDATIVAQNTVTVPAGEIDDAYLVRFEYTPITEGAIEGTQYYILAPDIGVVAMFGIAAGDEETGFTALDGVSVLVTLPEKR